MTANQFVHRHGVQSAVGNTRKSGQLADRPWHAKRSQRDTFWRPILRTTGIRWCRAHQKHHTYATNALNAGVNPTDIARQTGHKNAKMLFTAYAKWIDGADRGRELSKLEEMLGKEKTAQKAV
ncbi:MAG: tyrosine-type recombinase/integrase [Burkholderiaceae bacterium]|nr:tyrosine-type recombinase/integrase [Burkholderiaceae bacterium]